MSTVSMWWSRMRVLRQVLPSGNPDRQPSRQTSLISLPKVTSRSGADARVFDGAAVRPRAPHPPRHLPDATGGLRSAQAAAGRACLWGAKLELAIHDPLQWRNPPAAVGQQHLWPREGVVRGGRLDGAINLERALHICSFEL